jgi:hypothetical protein
MALVMSIAVDASLVANVVDLDPGSVRLVLTGLQTGFAEVPAWGIPAGT